MPDPLTGSLRLAGRVAGRLASLVGLRPLQLGSGQAPKVVWTTEEAEPSGRRKGARGVAAVRRATFEVVGGPNAPGAARAVLRQELADALDGRRLEDTLVLVSELVMNSVLHAGADTRHPVVVHLAVAPQRVRVEVCDEGPGFDPLTERERRGRRGFGTRLLMRMSRAWGVTSEDGLACVWFEVERGRRAAARAG